MVFGWLVDPNLKMGDPVPTHPLPQSFHRRALARRLLREDLGATGNKFYFDADTGEVTVNYVPVVKVDCPSPAETNVLWDREGLATYPALDKESILERFRAGARRVQAREGQWSL